MKYNVKPSFIYVIIKYLIIYFLTLDYEFQLSLPEALHIDVCSVYRTNGIINPPPPPPPLFFKKKKKTFFEVYKITMKYNVKPSFIYFIFKCSVYWTNGIITPL